MNHKPQLRMHWHELVANTPNSVLLETSRFDATNKQSFLFLNPVRILSASSLDEIPNLFDQVEEAIGCGLYVAGFVSYECGYHFQPVADRSSSYHEMPLAWFGVYGAPLINGQEEIASESDQPAQTFTESGNLLISSVDPAHLTITEDEYYEKIREIKDYIRNGDTYQVNFTDAIEVQISSSFEKTFATLSQRQPVAYSAFLNIAGKHHILSFSPELFFRIEGSRIVTRPMKGTMPRGLDLIEDTEMAARLRSDEKNRAEHVMIVDLLRNDLGRICAMGSVQVETLFSVEKYRTLFQMTSTVSGTLRPDLIYYDIFKSLFPSGSITGAPKIRTMEIIRELEQKPRGIYTGAIGFISPDRSSTFNVAIRTLVLKDGQARMGVGGGIVADSHPKDEYRECLLKTDFLITSKPEVQLFETLLWDGEFAYLTMHLDRMELSASYFGFSFDRPSIASQLAERSNSFLTGSRYRVKLLLNFIGKATIMATPYLPDHQGCRVLLSSERTSSNDVFLRHKTTLRDRYERLYTKARADGFDEVLFLNEREEVTEGAISNLFILRGDKLLTPPLSSGVLPGIFRRHLLEVDASAQEHVLKLQDLESADVVFLCNSLRGMRRVESICLDASLISETGTS